MSDNSTSIRSSPFSAARAFSAAIWSVPWPSATTASAWRCAGPDLAGHLQPLGRVGQIHAVQANLRHAGSVEAAARDADAADQSRRHPARDAAARRFKAVQGDGAEQVALAPPSAGARLVHVSALGADANSALALCAHQGGRRDGWCCAAMPDAIDHAALDHVRAGGQFLQPLRRAWRASRRLCR